MLQRWVDHEGVEHRVLEDYTRNVTLCDLSAQPDEIKQILAQVIADNSKPKEVAQVGVKLMKFCAKHELNRISEQVQSYSEPLNAKYV